MLREIRQFPGYTIDSDGNVYHGSKKLKPSIQPDGYIKVYLYKDGKRYARYLHRLVAEAFISNDDTLPEVNHKNKIKSACDVSNLEWTDRKGNMVHGKGRAVNQILNGKILNTFPTITAAAEAVNDKTHGANIHRCIVGKRPTAYGYVWRYANE